MRHDIQSELRSPIYSVARLPKKRSIMLKAQLEFGWWSSYSVRPPSPGKAATALQIPTHSGQVFRDDAGRDSDLKPATIPN